MLVAQQIFSRESLSPQTAKAVLAGLHDLVRRKSDTLPRVLQEYTSWHMALDKLQDPEMLNAMAALVAAMRAKEHLPGVARRAIELEASAGTNAGASSVLRQMNSLEMWAEARELESVFADLRPEKTYYRTIDEAGIFPRAQLEAGNFEAMFEAFEMAAAKGWRPSGRFSWPLSKAVEDEAVMNLFVERFHAAVARPINTSYTDDPRVVRERRENRRVALVYVRSAVYLSALNTAETPRERAQELVRGLGNEGPYGYAALMNQIQSSGSRDVPRFLKTIDSLLDSRPEDAEILLRLRIATMDRRRSVPLEQTQSHLERMIAAPTSIPVDRLAPVRVEAGLATWDLSPVSDELHAEIRAYMDVVNDQPPGQIRNASFALVEGKPNEALTWATRAIKIDTTAETYRTAARIAHSAARLEQAIDWMKQATDLSPSRIDLWYDLARLYGEAKQLDKAIEAFRQMTKLDPNLGRAWYNLGLALSQQGKEQEALQALERAEATMPDSPEPPYAAATIHFRLGDVDSARAAVIRSLQNDPGYVPALRPRN